MNMATWPHWIENIASAAPSSGYYSTYSHFHLFLDTRTCCSPAATPATFYDGWQRDGGRMIVLNEHSIKREKIPRQKMHRREEGSKHVDGHGRWSEKRSWHWAHWMYTFLGFVLLVTVCINVRVFRDWIGMWSVTSLASLPDWGKKIQTEN